jgi:hypothetical protein
MLTAAEHRLSNVPKAPSQIEWLTDYGSGYIAEQSPTSA